MNLDQLKIISAGAGSGKTYRLTQEMVELLRSGTVQARGIIATTFTRKAAAELQERVRVKLLSEGLSQQADELTNALIGTVHGLGVKLLRRFAFEAGVSPQVDILPEGEQQQMFNQALAAALSIAHIEKMESLCDQLGLTKRSGEFNWRGEVKKIVDVARANDFSLADLERSRQQSWTTFAAFLPDPITTDNTTAHTNLAEAIEVTITTLEQGEDSTKVTSSAIDKLRALLRELKLRGHLYWHQWAAIGKLKVGAKSRDAVIPLQEHAARHQQLPAFRQTIQAYIDGLFQSTMDALREYDDYKKRRGLIDYTDMEVLVSRLLDHPEVKAVLANELDLLMVDEFQDTSPIQLEIFLKLSQLADHSVWVGDPKQSIYGFRGAEPRLMGAIVGAAGGIKPENIQPNSWRSRADLVYLVNDLFCKAFAPTPLDQVALIPMRLPEGNDYSPAEDISMGTALLHWYFAPEEGRPPGKPWLEDSIARALKEWLDAKVTILPKGSDIAHTARAGDVAILCRSNQHCADVAAALHRAGLKAALARAGLLDTAEIRLVLACLRYLLQPEDSLSVAEIRMLASRTPLQDIVEDRLAYLTQQAETPRHQRPAWAQSDKYIAALDLLRSQLSEASSAETLHQILEELDLRRCVVTWGNSEQRLANIDQLRKLALEYETNCNNTHTAASLGGFLLWLSQLAAKKDDLQGAGEDADAVNVLTYHRSKGLEWPVVICHSLDQPLRADLWGIDLIAEQETVDLSNVLKGRWLRYWVNPYADQVRGTPLYEALQNSPAQAQKTQQALAEEARLLYVGFTRARDYLVLPEQDRKATKWLNRVWSAGDEGIPTLDAGTSDTPWQWEGHYLYKDTRVFTNPRQFTVADADAAQGAAFLPYHRPDNQHTAYTITAAELLSNTTEISQRHQYYAPQPSNEWTEPEVVARLRVDFFTVYSQLPTPREKRDQLLGMAERYLLSTNPGADVASVDIDDMLKQARAYFDWLAQNYPLGHSCWHVPVTKILEGRHFSTSIDQLIEDEQQYVFIRHETATNDLQSPQILKSGESLIAAASCWPADDRQRIYWVHQVATGKLFALQH